MPLQCRFRLAGILVQNAIDDLLVLFVAATEVFLGMLGDSPPLHQPFDKGFMQRDKDRVAGYLGQHPVELHVGAAKCRRVVKARITLLDRFDHPGDLGIGGVVHRIAKHAGFHEQPRLLEMGFALGAGKEEAGGLGDVGHHPRKRWRCHARALAPGMIHQAHRLQVRHGISDGIATDAEAFAQIAFGGKHLALGQHAVMNFRGERFRNREGCGTYCHFRDALPNYNVSTPERLFVV